MYYVVIVKFFFLVGWTNPGNKYLNAYKQFENKTCPIPASHIKNFVYFSRDRELIVDHPFLKSSRFSGAQIMYPWKQLEPKKNVYDFSIIRHDLKYLKQYKKTLFIQLQDATFNPKYKAVPDYLLSPEYDGGVTGNYLENGTLDGWVAKRWNVKVQKRFSLLLQQLGKEFDGEIEGINLQESAVEVTNKTDSSFTPEKYVNALKNNMLYLSLSFKKSVKMQYANFMPGEWLPWDDKGYLKSIYQYGEKIGVGLGGPDLMVRRKGQLNHAITMMHEHVYTAPLGIAIQDGNYIGQTNDSTIKKRRTNLVPMLNAFALEFLKVSYIFWSNQAPYLEEDVQPCFPDDK